MYVIYAVVSLGPDVGICGALCQHIPVLMLLGIVPRNSEATVTCSCEVNENIVMHFSELRR